MNERIREDTLNLMTIAGLSGHENQVRNYIKENVGLFIILGITSITVFNSIVYYSLYFTQVITGVLMISTIPVWIILISSLLKIEKTNIYQILFKSYQRFRV